jgi:hypothetical protein
MFFHLLKATLGKRAAGTEWSVYPDEKVGVLWRTLNDCLQAVARRPAHTEAGLFADFLRSGAGDQKWYLSPSII